MSDTHPVHNVGDALLPFGRWHVVVEQGQFYILSELNKIDGVESIASDGTFYIFPDFSKVMTKMGIEDDVKLAERILAEAEVALVPGSAFGSPGHMRISFATDMGSLEKALERIKKFVG